MTTTPAYATRVQAIAVIAQELFSTDRRRVEFIAATEADQTIALARATAKIDAVLWDGVIADDEQITMWPRVSDTADQESDETTEDSSAYIDPDPDPPADPPVAFIPAGVFRACIIQAAWEVAAAAGLNPNAHIEDAANKGVTSQSGGGMSESIDLNRANDPWSALCPDAQRLLRQYRRAGGAIA